MSQPKHHRVADTRRRAAQGATVAVACAGTWLALTSGDLASLVVGGPAVALATAASLRGEAPPPGRAGAAARFAPFLLREIFASAWYVASRVLRRRPRFDPGIVTYRMGLRGAAARAAFMNTVTLTPGTLAADLHGDSLSVHALDCTADVEGALSALEARVAALFAEPTELKR